MTPREAKRLYDRQSRQHQARLSKLLLQYQESYMEHISVKGEFLEKGEEVMAAHAKARRSWLKYCDLRRKKPGKPLQPRAIQFDEMITQFEDYTCRAHYCMSVMDVLKAHGIETKPEEFYPKPLSVILNGGN